MLELMWTKYRLMACGGAHPPMSKARGFDDYLMMARKTVLKRAMKYDRVTPQTQEFLDEDEPDCGRISRWPGMSKTSANSLAIRRRPPRPRSAMPTEMDPETGEVLPPGTRLAERDLSGGAKTPRLRAESRPWSTRSGPRELQIWR